MIHLDVLFEPAPVMLDVEMSGDLFYMREQPHVEIDLEFLKSLRAPIGIIGFGGKSSRSRILLETLIEERSSIFVESREIIICSSHEIGRPFLDDSDLQDLERLVDEVCVEISPGRHIDTAGFTDALQSESLAFIVEDSSMYRSEASAQKATFYYDRHLESRDVDCCVSDLMTALYLCGESRRTEIVGAISQRLSVRFEASWQEALLCSDRRRGPSDIEDCVSDLMNGLYLSESRRSSVSARSILRSRPLPSSLFGHDICEAVALKVRFCSYLERFFKFNPARALSWIMHSLGSVRWTIKRSWHLATLGDCVGEALCHDFAYLFFCIRVSVRGSL